MQTFTASEYLKIDIANSFGLDKLAWNERLQWFDQNEAQLPSLIKQAEKPAQYYAGLKAWEACKNKQPTGYPISLDATSSGIQILSCLTGDRQAAELSNVLDTGRRGDAYRTIYELMMLKLGGLKQPLPIVPYKDVKRAIMTAFYGSERVPKDVFGEGPLLGIFHQTLEETTPAVWELNKFFLEAWDPEALVHRWVMPDHFHVQIKVMDVIEDSVEFFGDLLSVPRRENRPVEKGRSLGANVTHSIDGFIVREMLRRCDFDPARVKELRLLLDEGPGAGSQEPSERTELLLQLLDLAGRSGYLSSRILDCIDATNVHLVDADQVRALLDSLPKKPFKIIPVHDCFRVHPNYGNDLRRQYNLQLSLIADSKMLEFLLSQVLGQDIEIHKLDQFAAEILDADYALS